MSKENREMNRQEYLDKLDELLQLVTVAESINYAMLITGIVEHIDRITGGSISRHIEWIILNRKLSFMQYTLLVDIYKIVQNGERREITDLLKYVEDSTGYKQYKATEIDKPLHASYNTELINLFTLLELEEIIAVVRVLATLSL